MQFEQDERFQRQREAFAFRFTCEDCVLYDTRSRSCAHGYPILEHRRARYDDPESTLIFCKDFELA